jgi:xylulokinase
VCQVPIARLEQDESSLLGAAMLAAVACGDHADIPAAASALTRVGLTVTPNPALAGIYTDAYARYRSLYRDLRPFNTALSSMENRREGKI